MVLDILVMLVMKLAIETVGGCDEVRGMLFK